MHERGEHCATDHDLEAEKSGRAKLTPQVRRLPHRHEPGLHIALDPARALASHDANLTGASSKVVHESTWQR